MGIYRHIYIIYVYIYRHLYLYYISILCIYTHTGESGDCQGDPERPEEGNKAENEGCGCGRVVLWNRMRCKRELGKRQRAE